MAPRKRIEAEARRQEIMGVALELFARDGLRGTTTKAIADAAGVSEALLYRHFAGKQELFVAIQGECLRGGFEVASALASLPRTTRTLVAVVHYMAGQIAEGRLEPKRHRHIKRLMLTSLAGDGAFARGFTGANMGPWIGPVAELLQAAHAAGDTDGPVDPAVARVWFAHHLFAMLGAHVLIKPPLADYGVTGPARLHDAVRFALRGMGLTHAAIARDYHPADIDKLIDHLAQTAPKNPRTEKGEPPWDDSTSSSSASASDSRSRSPRASRPAPTPRARSSAASKSRPKPTKRTAASSRKSPR